MRFEPKLYKLSNGMPVILDNMPEQEITDAKLVFFTGSRDEQPHEKGLTHFCEHMLCKGTKKFPSKKTIDEYFELNAGSRNASTGINFLSFYGYIISENINLLIEFLGDQIQNSLFDLDAIETERKVVLDELRRAKDSTARQFMDFCSQRLFNWATFSTKNLGTPETINSFSREQMLNFLSRRMSARNALLVISGKIIDENKILKTAENAFAFLAARDVPENKEIHYTPSVAHNLKEDKNNVMVSILFPEKYKSTYQDLFKELCVNRFRRYLIKNLQDVVRNENGLVYSIGGDGCGNEEFALTGIATATAADNMQQAIALIAKTAYDSTYKKQITDDVLARYNMADRLSDATFLESSSKRIGFLIAWYRDFGMLYEYEKMKEMKKGLTVKDIIDNSLDFFDGDMSILTQGPAFEGDLQSIWQENFK